MYANMSFNDTINDLLQKKMIPLVLTMKGIQISNQYFKYFE